MVSADSGHLILDGMASDAQGHHNDTTDGDIESGGKGESDRSTPITDLDFIDGCILTAKYFLLRVQIFDRFVDVREICLFWCERLQMCDGRC